MKKTSVLAVLIISALILFNSQSAQVLAHGGEEHETTEEAELHTQLSDEQMRTIIALLQKLVFLLTMKLEVQNAVSTYVPPVVSPTESLETTDDSEEMEDHHDEHGEDEETASEEEAHLIIEIEAHYEKTHVHVRYTDKPEDMFFATSPLSDEAGVIQEIIARTGLTEEVIREALVRL